MAITPEQARQELARRRGQVSPGLPGKEKVEKLIAERPRAEEALIKETLQPWEFKEHPIQTSLGAIPRLLTTGVKTLGVGFQRGEAGLANVLLKLQGVTGPETGFVTHKPWEELTFDEQKTKLKQQVQFIGEAGQAAWEGLTGERLGELGDIPRAAGASNFISSFIGLGSSMGAMSLLTKGKLLESANKSEALVRSKIPKVMNKDYLINRAKLASEGLDDLYTGLTNQYDDVFRVIGDKPINASRVAELLDQLPGTVANQVRKLVGKNINTISALKKAKGIIRKAVPKNIWTERQKGNEIQGLTKHIYFEINKLMVEGNPELVNLNQRYGAFMNMRKVLARVIYDTDGNVKSSGLANLFKPGAERNKQLFFESFAQQWPQAQQILKDATKFASRQAVKYWVRRFAPWIVGGAIGGGLIRGLGEGGGDFGGGQ